MISFYHSAQDFSSIDAMYIDDANLHANGRSVAKMAEQQKTGHKNDFKVQSDQLKTMMSETMKQVLEEDTKSQAPVKPLVQDSNDWDF